MRANRAFFLENISWGTKSDLLAIIAAMAEETSTEKKQPKTRKQRIWEIDFLRGLAVLLMVIDHFLWDCKYLPQIFTNFQSIQNPFIGGLRDFAYGYWYHPARYAAHLVFAGLFFILSGISCSLSKNNFWHGAKILGAGIIIDLSTYIIYWITGTSSMTMIFNVLISLGFGVLVVALLNLIPMPKPLRGWLYIGLGAAIFVTCLMLDLYWIIDNATGTSSFQIEHLWDYIRGFQQWGSDYFSIIPYLAYTLIGAGIGVLVYQEKKTSLLPKLDGMWNRPVCFLGRNTLWVYLIHQIPLWIILGGLCLILGYRF